MTTRKGMKEGLEEEMGAPTNLKFGVASKVKKRNKCGEGKGSVGRSSRQGLSYEI